MYAHVHTHTYIYVGPDQDIFVPCCYVVSELVKCCSRRVFCFEAVLVVDRRYVIGDVP